MNVVTDDINGCGDRDSPRDRREHASADIHPEVVAAVDALCCSVETAALRYEVPLNAAAIAWDTETTGLNGVVVQLGVVCVDVDGVELFATSRMLAPIPGHPIEGGAYAVHGISEDAQRARGEPVRKSVEAFVDLARAARKREVALVAHNASFDRRMLRNTARAAGMADAEVEAVESECTMLLGKRVSQARRGTNKRPKNSELYEMLVGPVPDAACLHDAVEDARLTARSFMAGRAQGFW